MTETPPSPETRSGPGGGPAAPAPAPPPEELLPALAAFERGDFRQARLLVAALLAGSPTPEVAAAARALEGRMAPDPWAIRVGLVALAVLALVAGIYI
jgi:hypothetical protein